MPEIVIGRTLQEFELSDPLRAEPNAIHHLRGGEALP